MKKIIERVYAIIVMVAPILVPPAVAVLLPPSFTLLGMLAVVDIAIAIFFLNLN